MKEKDLYVDNKTHEIILFAEKENETYEAITSGSYVVEHHLDDFFLMKENLEIMLRKQLKGNEISPVYYFMVMQDMGPGDLAKRVGISKRKLRKHFKPDIFAKLDDSTLQKYALVFGLNVEQIMEINTH